MVSVRLKHPYNEKNTFILGRLHYRHFLLTICHVIFCRTIYILSDDINLLSAKSVYKRFKSDSLVNQITDFRNETGV